MMLVYVKLGYMLHRRD